MDIAWIVVNETKVQSTKVTCALRDIFICSCVCVCENEEGNETSIIIYGYKLRKDPK